MADRQRPVRRSGSMPDALPCIVVHGDRSRGGGVRRLRALPVFAAVPFGPRGPGLRLRSIVAGLRVNWCRLLQPLRLWPAVATAVLPVHAAAAGVLPAQLLHQRSPGRCLGWRVPVAGLLGRRAAGAAPVAGCALPAPVTLRINAGARGGLGGIVVGAEQSCRRTTRARKSRGRNLEICMTISYAKSPPEATAFPAGEYNFRHDRRERTRQQRAE